MNNFIYKGSIRHRRFTPFTNIFNYNTFMVFFDINNVEKFLVDHYFSAERNLPLHLIFVVITMEKKQISRPECKDYN